MKVSAVIIAFNEETKIADAIRSVQWADEVLVVDSESTDRTREIAESLRAKVLIKPWLGFGPQKQFAVQSAEFDMVLSIDADEVVTASLRDEIRDVLSGPDPLAAYRMPRLASYLGREIRHSGWYPDAQIRLFDRRKGGWKQSIVHESVEMENGVRVGLLKGDIVHNSFDGIRQHAEMISTRYAPLSAEAMFAAGRRTGVLKIAFAPIAAFVSSYVFRLGFLDGPAGLIIAYFAAYNVFLKHVLLWEKLRAVGDDALVSQNYN